MTIGLTRIIYLFSRHVRRDVCRNVLRWSLWVGVCTSSPFGYAQSDWEERPERLVWSEETLEGARINFAEQTQTGWTQSELLSDGEVFDVAPCIVTAGDQHWVVWTRMETWSTSFLVIRHFDGDQWLPETRIETRTAANTGAMLGITPGDKPLSQLWLVWAGFDGEDDDIYYSVNQGRGRGWSDPALIHEDNAFPDIQPLLGLSESGYPWIMWRGYNGDKYALLSTTWQGSGFAEPTPVAPQDTKILELSELSDWLPLWPSEITRPRSACMTTPSQIISSLPLRLVVKHAAGESPKTATTGDDKQED